MEVAVRAPEYRFECALVVEPIPNLRKIVSGMLPHAGTRAEATCMTPVEAIRIIEARNCDPVIVGSSYGAGEALASALRKSRDTPNRNVPIVLMAKTTDREVIMSARDAGVDTMLAVPFSAAALTTRLQVIASSRPAMVVSESYVGPDRRRQDRPFTHEDRRIVTQPIAPPFEFSCDEILLEFVKAKRPAQTHAPAGGRPKASVVMGSKPTVYKSNLQERRPEMRCTINDIEVGQSLARDVKSNSGLVIVPKGQEITRRTHTRLIDLVNAGEIEDLFYLALGIPE